MIGSILAATYASHVNVGGLSSTVASQVKNSYATATKMPAPIPDRASAAFVSAMHICLLTAAGAALVAAAGVFILLAGRSQRASKHQLKDALAGAAVGPAARSGTPTNV